MTSRAKVHDVTWQAGFAVVLTDGGVRGIVRRARHIRRHGSDYSARVADKDIIRGVGVATGAASDGAGGRAGYLLLRLTRMYTH